jgi:hypothetical protein
MLVILHPKDAQLKALVRGKVLNHTPVITNRQRRVKRNHTVGGGGTVY